MLYMQQLLFCMRLETFHMFWDTLYSRYTHMRAYQNSPTSADHNLYIFLIIHIGHDITETLLKGA